MPYASAVHQPSSLYKCPRFPGELISHAAWLYYRFLLSYRDVEELLAERGLAVSDDTIRRWCRTFGQTVADGLCRRRARPGDKWHINEVQLKTNGRKHWLWRAVDQQGVVLDILVQSRRNQEAAAAFLRRPVDGRGYEPWVVITDKLASGIVTLTEKKLKFILSVDRGPDWPVDYMPADSPQITLPAT